MKKVHWTEVAAAEVTEPGAERIQIRWAVGDEDGAPNVALRVFDVEGGGHTPYHEHAWEHAVFVLEGEGSVRRPDGAEVPLGPGDVVYVPPGERHSFLNAGSETFRFICVIPSRGVCLATAPGGAASAREPRPEPPDGTR